ncbi:MAG: Fimbrial assembly family protein [Candidatus Saccharibacteria bacterium]|nr:Fimbrial assembly family protein [Candidatus Saccharibacteria bacterium]
MINLLPDTEKKQLRAAHANVLLVRYIFISLGALVLVGAFIGGTYFVLLQSELNAKDTVEQNQQKAAQFSDVKAQADTLSANITAAKSILDQDIPYSGILTAIGQATPEGAIIKEINITAAAITAPMTLQAYAKTAEDATALQNQYLSAPVFSSVVSQGMINNDPTAPAGYPVSVKLTVTINKAGVTP